MATDTLASPATLGTIPTKVFKNFIDGEWVESSTGETFENRNPADTRDVVGIFQKSAKADVDAAVDAAKRAFAKWRLVPAPRRAEIVFPRRRNSHRAQRRLCPRDDPRNGQSAERNSRRCAGGHRRRLLQRWRRPPYVRPYRSFGAAQQIRHGGAPADRRLRHDHAVEFSHGDFLLEAAARRSFAATPASSSRRRILRSPRSIWFAPSPTLACRKASSTSSLDSVQT